MQGPGKYDHILTAARESAEAEGAILIVLSGTHGHGFSAQLPSSMAGFVPELLRQVAADIEREADIVKEPT